MTPDREYWRRRSEQVALMQYEKADRYAERLLKEYQRAIRRIERDIEAFYVRYAVENQVTMDEARRLLTAGELREFRMTLEEFIEKAKNNVDGRWTRQLNAASYKARISRLEALLIQIRQEVEVLLGNAHAGTQELLAGIYEDTYYRTVYEVQRGLGIGVSFAPLDRSTIEKAIMTPWLGENYSERIWANRDKLVRELQTKLTQAFIRGEGVAQTAKDLAERMQVSYSSAERIVRTESSFVTHQATWDGYKASGVVEQYEYLATLDSRTSEICRAMDGKVFRLSEKEVGVNYPPLHPNCRSTVVPYFDDEDDPGERIARDADGDVYYVPGNMTYREWLERYVEGR
jgi:SPP1 gp7 family putative phage head morphogenesis protein